jgi:DNA polymerase (family 10)
MSRTNADVAEVLSRLATMLEIDGANPFRVRAYREGARVVESQAEPVAALAASEGALEALPGIGKDLAAKIRDIAATGTTALYDEMRSRIPLEVVGLTELQGMGPKRVRTVFEALGVRNRDGLEKAAKAGRLRDLPGFGEKVEQNVLKALATASQHAGRVLLHGAWALAHALAAHVATVKGVTQVEIAGSFRRRRETVGDLDLLVCGGAADAVMDAFTAHPDVADVLGRGDTKSSVRLRNGLQVDLRAVPAESFGAALLYFTGSKEHNIELRRLANEQGLTLNEYGLARERNGRVVAARTEHDVYRALGLAWIPPELREARGEIEWAREDRLPRLLEESDLVADLHMHTDRSDGRDTIDAMVRAARARGYRYVALTEHSQSLAMARGFDTARVRRSVEEIAAARERHPGMHILHGLEVDILADGALDLDDAGLALLDWVVVSLHSRLDQPADAVTERVLRALDHPAVCAMGHPTGRLIGTRPPAAFDAERVFERAAERGVAMEINAQPDRLDLNDVHARLAREKGVRFVVDTDAHSTVQLEHIRYGVFVARRAGLGPDDVLNALPLERFEAWRRGRRGVAPRAAARRAAGAAKPAAQPAPKRPATRPAATRPGAPKAARKPVPKAAPKRRGTR